MAKRKKRDMASLSIIDRAVKAVDMVKAHKELRYDSDFSDDSGIGKMTICRWRDRTLAPSTADIYKLWFKYRISPSWIVGGSGKPFEGEGVDAGGWHFQTHHFRLRPAYVCDAGAGEHREP